MRILRACLFLVSQALTLTLLPTQASAQPARLSGQITDDSGAPVRDITVIATDLATGVTFDTVTLTDGLFVFPTLSPGRYRLEVNASGFRPLRREGVILNVATTTTVNLRLQVGDVTDRVEVTGTAPLIERQSGSVGTVVDRQFIENLPLNGRSLQSLLELVPGVMFVEPDIFNTGQFSVNGQRANANYVMVDGVSANVGTSMSAQSFQQAAGTVPAGTAMGGTQGLVSVDALEEFRMLTSTFAPEFGRMPGGQVSLVTRSGRSRYSGSLYDFARHEQFDANDWFNNQAGRAKLPLRQHQFGGTLGGPVARPGRVPGRPRAFFFASYEGLRLRQPQPDIRNVVVPSTAARARATGSIKALFDAFPLPNAPALPGDPTDTERYTYRISFPSWFEAPSLRVDVPLGPVQVFNRTAYSPSGYREFVFANQQNEFSKNFVSTTTGVTWTMSPRLVSDTRVNWSRETGRFAFAGRAIDGATLLPDSLVFPDQASRETVSVSLQVNPSNFNPTSLTQGKSLGNNQEQFNLVQTLTYLRGRHEMKAGVDWRRLMPLTDFRERGITYNFGSVTQALQTGLASVSVQALAPTTNFRIDNLSLFLQDTWRVSSRLTVTAGARYELNPPPSGDRLPFTFTDVDNLLTADLAPAGTPLWRTDRTNIAPRLDAAYVLSERQELVLRGGIGLFYDLGTGTALRGYSSYPFNSQRSTPNQPFPAPASVVAAAPFDTTTRPISSTFHVTEPDLRLPSTLQWNVSMERRIGTAQSLTVSYVGARGRDLLRTEQLRNRPAPTEVAFGIPTMTFINPAVVSSSTSVFVTRNAATSRYDALQVQFQRRMSRGVQSMLSYTLAKSTDTVSNEVTAGLSSTGIPGFSAAVNDDAGPSDFDIRHVVAGGLTWNLPSPSGGAAKRMLGDWGLDLIGRWRSAPPLHVVTQTIDPINFSGTNRRVNLVAGQDPWIADATVPGGKRLNFAAFEVPASGQQGTMTRNSLRWIPAQQLDLSLRKDLPVGRTRAQLRWDIFNITNTPNFAEPGASLPAAASPLFGVSTRMLNRALGPGGTQGGLNPQYQVGGPRSMQLSLRVSF
jgi:hypothetical protein